MSANVLDISDACRAFVERPALQGVSLQVATGEIVALLGPNGAGKTTLMRAIAGRLALDTGSVSVCGHDPVKDRTARRALGIVPQSIALYPQLTARQNLEVLGRLSGLTKQQTKAAVELAFERTALARRADDRLSDLSGGMQRRLNIIAGTLHNPQLLLLDEPTVGVDLQACEAIFSLLTSLSQSGIGILMSTHDFGQAAEVADRAVIMSQGRILIEGTVSGLIHDFFGDAKEVVVTLTKPASPDVLKTLQTFGLSIGREDRVWSGPLPDGYSQLVELEARLAEQGAQVAEMRVHEPDLAGVFIQLMKQGAVQ